MGLVLKFHCAPEQVSSLLESVSQRLHITGLHKVMATITEKTFVAISKTMDSLVIASSVVELWHFSQEFHDIVASVWNLSKAMEQCQIFSGEFLVNLRKYSFTVRRISLAGRLCNRDPFLLLLIVSNGTGIRCSRALFMYLLVSTSGWFWNLLLVDTKIHKIDLTCIWLFYTVLGCLYKALLLTYDIQHNIPMALVILVIEPKIQFKRHTRVHSSKKITVHMLSIGIFELNLLLPYKSHTAATCIDFSLLRFQHFVTVESGTSSMD